MDTHPQIQERFVINLGRVDGLIEVYEKLRQSQGRPSVATADVLRSAVLFLHATLEDVMRSVEEVRLPRADRSAFNPRQSPVRFPGGQDKLSLFELAEYRGQTVDEVFRRSIEAYLERSNYNNIAQLEQALERAGIDHVFKPEEKRKIDAMMRRRHWIAHRADRNLQKGRGHHTAQSLDQDQVRLWSTAVGDFCRGILKHLEGEAP